MSTTVSGKQNALGFTPVQQGGGGNQGSNKIYLGWNSSASALSAQVDTTNIGNLLTQNNFASFISNSSTWTVPSTTPDQYVFTIDGSPYTCFTGWNNCVCYVNEKLKLAWIQLVLSPYSQFVGKSFGNYPILGTGFPKPKTNAWIQITNNYDYSTTVAKIGTDGKLTFAWGRASTSGMSSSNWFIGTLLYPIV